VPRRLARWKSDPWKEYFRARQRLPKGAVAALDGLVERQRRP